MYLRRRRSASRARGRGRASTVLGGRREQTSTNEPRLVSNSAITLQLVLSVDDTEYPRFRGGEVLLGLRGVRRLFPRDLGERLALLLPLDPSNPVAVEEVLLRLLCDPGRRGKGGGGQPGKKEITGESQLPKAACWTVGSTWEGRSDVERRARTCLPCSRSPATCAFRASSRCLATSSSFPCGSKCALCGNPFLPRRHIHHED